MQIIEDLKSKQSFVANLPKFHADLAARAQELNTSHHAKLEVLHLTQDRVSSMLEEYDPTCWRTIEADLLTTSDALYSSQDLLEDVGDPSTEFSIDKLTKDFATLGAVEAKLETFDSYAAAIEKHHQRLSSLRESLPGSITGLRAEFEGAVAYIRANEIDITDTTEEEVVAHRARIEQLVTAIGQPKPQLLGIETELDKVKQAFEKSYKKAQDERQEIIDLLDSIDELQRQADKAIRGVRHYEDSNPDVDTETEDFIASLRLPQNPRSRDRALLRTARHELEYALASAQDAMRDARNDVDREQAKRAAALARQRAQRAEAARAASTPRFTSGGSSRRGSSNSGTFKPPKR